MHNLQPCCRQCIACALSNIPDECTETAVYYEQLPIRQANVDNKLQVIMAPCLIYHEMLLLTKPLCAEQLACDVFYFLRRHLAQLSCCEHLCRSTATSSSASC